MSDMNTEPQGVSPMFEIMKAARDQVAAIKHKGNMTTRAEAQEMPIIIGLVSDMLDYRATEYRKQSLEPEFVDMYVKGQEALIAVANLLNPLGEYFDALHPERVRDLTQGNNPEAWDTYNNQTIG